VNERLNNIVCCPVSISQICAVPSPDPDTISLPSLEKSDE
jgi:hypothetical protein